jgi:hypothetical protein
MQMRAEVPELEIARELIELAQIMDEESKVRVLVHVVHIYGS